MIACPKFTYVRSPALLKACRALPCQHCGRDDGSVCAAHSNQSHHGKGRSIKASDVFTAALCSTCHREVDQGHRLSRNERLDLWTNAWRSTVRALVQQGKWPAEIPIPDIRTFH